MATLRPDGFAGYCQVDNQQAGKLTTTPVVYRGEEIRITADVALGGSIAITILDGNDDVIAEQTVASSITDAVVMPAASCSVRDMRIEFTAHSAQLFSFSLVDR